jgi:hypothetical protein
LQQFTNCHYIDKFSPWEDIVSKKVSKLRSIAELRAFDGTFESGFLRCHFLGNIYARVDYVQEWQAACSANHLMDVMTGKL